MRVLAVDPGYDRCGVAVMEHDGAREVLVHSDCLSSEKTAAPADRLHTLGAAFAELIATHNPDTIALETLFFNKNQKTAMMVAEARGILIFLAKTHGAAVFEYSPQQIKIAVTGHGGSDKKAVTDMVKRLVPSAPERAHDDEYDAIAVGITCLASERHFSTRAGSCE